MLPGIYSCPTVRIYLGRRAVYSRKQERHNPEKHPLVFLQKRLLHGYNPITRYHLATAYAFLGKHNQAILHYQALLEAKPHYIPALINCAIAEAQSGNTQQARTLFKRALDLDPQNRLIQHNLKRLALQKNTRKHLKNVDN